MLGDAKIFRLACVALLGAIHSCACDPEIAVATKYFCKSTTECRDGSVCVANTCEPLALKGDGGVFSAQLKFVTPTIDARATECIAVTVGLVDAAGAETPAQTNLSIHLSLNPAAALTAYGDTGCATALTSDPVVAAGMRSVTVGIKVPTGNVYMLSAAAPGFATATQSATIRPLVRRSTCMLPNGQTQVSCALTPAVVDVTKSFVISQIQTSLTSPDSTEIRCALTSKSSVTCDRTGTSGDVMISLQVAEIPTNVMVQNVTSPCLNGANTTTASLNTAVSRDEAFILYSQLNSGGAFDFNDFHAHSLDSPMTVRSDWTGSCAATKQANVQVVEWKGIEVTRVRQTGWSYDQATKVVNFATGAPSASSVVLASYATSDTVNTVTCDRFVRVSYDEQTQAATLSRGNGAYSACFSAGSSGSVSTPDPVELERINFKNFAKVQQVDVAMTGSELTKSLTIQLVDPTRTLVFSNHSPSGEGLGENDSNAGNSGHLGASTAVHTLTNGTTLTLTRGAAQGAAKWTSYVVEFSP